MNTEDLLIAWYSEYRELETDDQREDFWNNLPKEDVYKINQEVTLHNGIGEDKLVINEYSRDSLIIENYNNLLDWDIDCWDDQRQLRLQDKYCSCDIGEYDFYKGLAGEWIRLIEDSRLIYGNLYSLPMFLWWQMEDLIYDIENQIVPHELHWNTEDDENPNLKKVNITVDAYEREEEYEKLKQLTYKFLTTDESSPGYKLILETFKDIKGTFRINMLEDPIDPMTDFIVCDQETLSKINPKTFLKDFSSCLNNDINFENFIIEFKNKVEDVYRKFVSENL